MVQAITSEFPKSLLAGDFTTTDAALDATNYQDVATYQVPPKQRIFWGNGAINLGVDDRGTFTMNLNTSAPADIAAVSRLILRDANGIRSRFIREDISNDYESGVKVGKGGKTGNEQNLLSVGEDEYLVIQAKMQTGTATVSWSDSTVTAPVTIQTLSS